MRKFFILLTIFLAAAFLMKGYDLFSQASRQERIVELLVIIAIVLTPIVVTFYIIYRKVRSKEKYLAQLRSQKPVAYFCTFSLSGDISLISSDNDEIIIWAIADKRLVPDIVLTRKDANIVKGKVRIAALRTADGLVLSCMTAPETKVPLHILRDKLGLTYPSLKEPELSKAIERIKAGK